MAEEDEKIPAIPVEDEVLSLDELMEIYLGAYKWLTGENWPYPVETIEDMRKLARKIIEIETELKNRGEWPPEHHANKHKRKSDRTRRSSSN